MKTVILSSITYYQLPISSLKEIDLSLSNSRFWIPEIELGLGVWEGSYHNIQQPWLRWYDVSGNWVLTPIEQKERLIEQLRTLGVEPDI